jgi:hypothetical protein
LGLGLVANIYFHKITGLEYKDTNSLGYERSDTRSHRPERFGISSINSASFSGLFYLKPEKDAPSQPKVPKIITNYTIAKAILRDHPHRFIHPACLDENVIPGKVKEILNRRGNNVGAAKDNSLKEFEVTVLNYFTAMTREIVKREFITIREATNDKTGAPQPEDPIYQIDVVRE